MIPVVSCSFSYLWAPDDNKDIIRHIDPLKAAGSHGQFGFDDNCVFIMFVLAFNASFVIDLSDEIR